MKIRSKLMAATAMLLVSAVMMTTASFAWFTISTAPEISNITATAAANGNLEIALDNGYANAEAIPASKVGDTGTYTTWGNLVDMETLMNGQNVVLKPVQLGADGKVSIPIFGTDGRIGRLQEVTATGTGLKLYKDTAQTAWAMGVDFWLRSNVAGDVTLLMPAEGTDLDRGAGTDGQGTSLTVTAADGDPAANIKLAFLVGNTLVAPAENGQMPAATTKIVSLTENVAQKVTAILYMDGEGMTNADFANATQDVALNLQFEHSENLNDMGVTGVADAKPAATEPAA